MLEAAPPPDPTPHTPADSAQTSSPARYAHQHTSLAIHSTHSGTNRPPNQCRPLKPFTPSLGAVKLTSTSGSNVSTDPVCPFSSGSVYSGWKPSETLHPDGMSMETMGRDEDFMRRRMVSNGARTGGWKEKPNPRPFNQIMRELGEFTKNGIHYHVLLFETRFEILRGLDDGDVEILDLFEETLVDVL